MLSNHRLPGNRFLLPVAAILIAAAGLGSALLALRQFAEEARREIAQVTELQQALHAAALASAPACSAEIAYAYTLSPQLSLDKFVQSLQDSAKAFDVTVKSVSGEPHAQTMRALAAIDVNIALHGTYPGIKAVLAEGLARFPTGTLAHLHLKRDGIASPPMEDATAQVTFALRPPGSGPLDCHLDMPDRAAQEASR